MNIAGTPSTGGTTMKPWLQVDSFVAMASTPSVARLVIKTDPGGKIRAPLLASPSGVIEVAESATYRERDRVRSLGVNHGIWPSTQYSARFFDGVPPPSGAKTDSAERPNSIPFAIRRRLGNLDHS